MSINTLAFYAVFLLIILVLVKPLGGYMARVFAGQKTWLDPALRPVERFIYALCRINAQEEMNARQYAMAFVLFSLAGKLRTDSLLFASVIVGTALIVVALTYLPAVALGPIIEQLRF